MEWPYLTYQSGSDQGFCIHPPIYHLLDWGSRLIIFPLFLPQGELLSPCRCDGSVKCTHQPCLIKWISERGCWSCELCYYKYHVIAISTKNPLQVNPGFSAWASLITCFIVGELLNLRFRAAWWLGRNVFFPLKSRQDGEGLGKEKNIRHSRKVVRGDGWKRQNKVTG